MKEKEIIAQILDGLRKMGAKVVKFHGNQYTENGNPDIVGVIMGRGLAIEVKVPGKKPTKIQAKRLMEWSNAGAITFWTSNAEECLAIVAEVITPQK